MGVFERFGVRTVINAAGPVTRYGGACLSAGVLSAMAEATGSFVRLDELQQAASQRLAEWTGAEAGYVTSGAAAGLTLGAAAMMVGMDADRMQQLPDASGMANEFLMQACHRSDYDMAIRASGARLVDVEVSSASSADEVRGAMSAARSDRTCATAYVYRTDDRGVSLETWVQCAKSLGLGVLVDGAVRLPPAENLRRIPGTGADLAVFSGGKAIGGPQNSGIVLGRADLIDSILLQNQDLDFNRETWFLRDWLESGRLTGLPRNGIGRGFKVSKENVVGLVTALEEYLAKDHAAELASWHGRIDRIVAELKGVSGIAIEKVFDGDGPYPVPVAKLRLTDGARMTLVDFVKSCADLDRPVLFEEGPLHEGNLIVHPMRLPEADAEELIVAVRGVLSGRN
jgi:L-seryl-tRNA(Ser) seleniumtransferase